MWKRVEFEAGGPSGANAAPIRRGTFGRSAFSAESAASSGVFGAVRFVLDVAADSSTSSASFGTRYLRRVELHSRPGRSHLDGPDLPRASIGRVVRQQVVGRQIVDDPVEGRLDVGGSGHRKPVGVGRERPH
jgi:hypothetical protein